jgi:hypothetical protein
MATRKRRRILLGATEMKKYALASSRKYWNQRHKREGVSKCVKQNSKKSRPSPPYSANECCGKTLTGNDGQKYKSKPNVSGICTWIKI